MKTLQDHANEIAEAKWAKKKEALEIIKAELIAYRKCTPEEAQKLMDKYRPGERNE